MPDVRNVEVTLSDQIIKDYIKWHIVTFKYLPVFQPFYSASGSSETLIMNPVDLTKEPHKQAARMLFELFGKKTESDTGATQYRLKVASPNSTAVIDYYYKIGKEYVRAQYSVPSSADMAKSYVRWYHATNGPEEVYDPLGVDDMAIVQIANPNSPNASKWAEEADKCLRKMWELMNVDPDDVEYNLRLWGPNFRDQFTEFRNEDAKFIKYDKIRCKWLYSVNYDAEKIKQTAVWWGQSSRSKEFLKFKRDEKSGNLVVLAETEAAAHLRALYGLETEYEFDLLLVGETYDRVSSYFTSLIQDKTIVPEHMKPLTVAAKVAGKVNGKDVEEEVLTVQREGVGSWSEVLMGTLALPSAKDFMDFSYVKGLAQGFALGEICENVPAIKSKLDAVWMWGKLMLGSVVQSCVPAGTEQVNTRERIKNEKTKVRE